jgi:two-component system, LuxR family, sensor kinase FixL
MGMYSEVRTRSELASRLKAVFESAVDGIIIINQRGVIEEMNPAAAQLFEYTVNELIGLKINILMPQPYSSEHDRYISNYVHSGHKKIIGIGREVIGLKKSGSEFPFWLSVSEVKLDDRIIYTGFIHDLSKTRNAEEKLQQLNEDLENLVVQRTYELERVVNKLLDLNKRFEDEIKAHVFTESLLRRKEAELIESLKKEKELGELKSRFVAMASHEFRTPLSTIMSSVALLKRYTTEAQQENRERHIIKIMSAVTHLTGILNDFLSVSKFDEGKISANREFFDLHSLLKDIIEEMSVLLKSGQSINLMWHSQNSQVHSDPKIIKNILINLLSNAIKYSDDTGKIDFKVEVAEEKLIFMVRDHGIGIPEADQKYLFDRFFRASNATNIEGTGLGLNIVKKYLELLGGTISVESKLSEGTAFNIEIPNN